MHAAFLDTEPETPTLPVLTSRPLPAQVARPATALQVNA